MSFLHEYALLAAVLFPVGVLVAMQAYLYMNGERGTLLMPMLAGFPKIELEAEPKAVDVSPAVTDERRAEVAANDTCEEAA